MAKSRSALALKPVAQKPPALKPVPPVAEPLVLRLQAYEGFKQQLLESNLRPGEFVSQRKLCALIGLPLGAIREVIPRLEAEGLIKTVPQRGLQIANVDLKLVKNAFQLRMILEREGALRYGETVTDKELDALSSEYRSIIDRAKRDVTRELLDEAQAADWGMHDRMIDSLGNEIISQLYRVNCLCRRLAPGPCARSAAAGDERAFATRRGAAHATPARHRRGDREASDQRPGSGHWIGTLSVRMNSHLRNRK